MPAGEEGVLINIYQSVPTTLFRGIRWRARSSRRSPSPPACSPTRRRGGTPASPLVYFNRQFPTAIKDFMEVYYDSPRRGVDERGLDGTGMIMKMNQGKRYQPGQWPVGDTAAFNDPTALDTTDNPPGGGDPDHEQDGHKHDTKCLSC